MFIYKNAMFVYSGQLEENTQINFKRKHIIG